MIEAIVTRSHNYRMPYSVGVRVPAGSELIFVAGLNALPLYHDHPHVADDLAVPGDAAEQTRLALEGMREVLQAAGASLRDVVRLDIYVTDMANQNSVARELGSCFQGDCPPAMTLLAVSELVTPDLVVEINAIAAVPTSRP